MERHLANPEGHNGGELDADGKWTPKRQCSARSRQSGVRCRRWAIRGGTVCVMHGGKTPNVMRAAKMRLLELVDPAIATLAKEMVKADLSSDRQKAANSILDRAGIPRSIQQSEPEVVTEYLLEKLKERRRALGLDDEEGFSVEDYDEASFHVDPDDEEALGLEEHKEK